MTLRIGTAAARAGVNVQTFHYYERRGLIPSPRRSTSGYRQYDADTVRRVRAIKRAQSLGFTLRQVQELNRLRSRRRPVGEVLKVTQSKLDEIDGKIRSLRRMRRTLKAVLEGCRCGGDLSKCDVLEGLGEEEA